jgi:molecular chaperone GrpE (heat shock protein)
MSNANPTIASVENTAKKPSSRTPKKRASALEKLTSEDLQTLRLDERSHAEFDAVVQRFNRSKTDLQAFEGEDVASMGSARYDRLSAAEGQQHSDGMAVVHFLAPRILRLRDGEAKRKWRSFLAKFRKDEKLS